MIELIKKSINKKVKIIALRIEKSGESHKITFKGTLIELYQYNNIDRVHIKSLTTEEIKTYNVKDIKRIEEIK